MYVENRIVIVTNIPAPYRVDLFYYMQTHLESYEVHVIYTRRNEDNRQWTLDEDKLLNTTILNSGIIKIKGQMDNRYIHLPGNIISCLKDIAPDIVIAFEYNPAALQCLAWCKIHGKKFIHLTDGTLYSERNIGKIQKLARKILVSNANAFIASSSKAKEKLIHWGAPENKIFMSLLTINIDKYKGIKKEFQTGRILYVGSMAKRKGLDLLINALANVREKFSLRVVGDGSEDDIQMLKCLAEKKGIVDKITWCGFKEGQTLLDEYCKAEVFVLPTREDCFGLVLVEAMCAKLPIIVSKYADGAYDVVREGVNGCIVDPFDAAVFGEAINKVLIDSKMRKSADEVSCEKFEFRNVVKGYLEAIEFAIK